MTRERTWAARLFTANMVLTLAAFLVVVASFGFGLRGGSEHRAVDLVQFGLLWGYLVGTPLLAMGTFLAREISPRERSGSVALLVLWALALTSSFLLHR